MDTLRGGRLEVDRLVGRVAARGGHPKGNLGVANYEKLCSVTLESAKGKVMSVVKGLSGPCSSSTPHIKSELDCWLSTCGGSRSGFQGRSEELFQEIVIRLTTESTY